MLPMAIDVTFLDRLKDTAQPETTELKMLMLDSALKAAIRGSQDGVS